MSETQRVTIEPPKLDPDAAGVTLTALLILALRALLLWGTVAILVPQFGIVYWQVVIILIGWSALRGSRDPHALTHAANGAAQKRREREAKVTKADDASRDDALLMARAT